MLLIALAVLATQDVAVPMPNLGRQAPQTSQRFRVQPDGSVVNLNHERCETLLRRVSPGAVAEPLGRAGEARVKMYYLLDRRIDGCAAPLIVSDTLPDANAARGRNLLRQDSRSPR